MQREHYQNPPASALAIPGEGGGGKAGEAAKEETTPRGGGGGGGDSTPPPPQHYSQIDIRLKELKASRKELTNSWKPNVQAKTSKMIQALSPVASNFAMSEKTAFELQEAKKQSNLKQDKAAEIQDFKKFSKDMDMKSPKTKPNKPDPDAAPSDLNLAQEEAEALRITTPLPHPSSSSRPEALPSQAAQGSALSDWSTAKVFEFLRNLGGETFSMAAEVVQKEGFNGEDLADWLAMEVNDRNPLCLPAADNGLGLKDPNVMKLKRELRKIEALA